MFRAPMFMADGAVMQNKTIIVTGSNTGIGFETASELAKYGGRVILACRNLQRAQVARTTIIDRFKSLPEHQDIEQRVVVKQLDLASLKSVREFADDVLQNESHLDVLINNAGVYGIAERTLTEDGLEMTMASNHFGHFLLTNLLLPLLKRSAPSRIVVVSTISYKTVKSLDFENLNSEKHYDSAMALSFRTKLANVLFTRHLAKQLEGTGVVVNALHPGLVETSIFNSFSKIALFAMKPIFYFFSKSALQGAQTSVFLAASQAPEALVTGRFFDNMKEVELSTLAKDEAVAEKLWKLSEKLTGLSQD